jgi:hypothetical protein
MFFLLFVCGGISPVVAQRTVTLQGKVIDERSKESIIGANVLVKNDRTTGVATNVNGDFSLSVPSLPVTIVVSYIGYKSQEIDI